jgi:hypothetical protein
MPLTNLHCDDTRIFDLLPLKDCSSLTDLRCTKTKVTPAAVAALQKALPNCKIEWDDPAKPAAVQPKQRWNTPAFQAWVKEVQAMPAEEQVRAVSKKLMELNPGFDGQVHGYDWERPPKIENGVVTEFRFSPDNVTDMAPVRALAGLKKLVCAAGYDRRGKLSDLSPLEGMPLTNLVLFRTNIADLSPLAGMPLVKLDCSVTQVSDLSPLKGMPLTHLVCGASPVSDLSPLRGMSLTQLNCGESRVSDLSPLQGMPLTKLDCYSTKIFDLSPLKGMPLTTLSCASTPLADLTPLQDVNLTDFFFTPKNINKGMDVLRKMKSLKTVSARAGEKPLSTEEFWKKYDAGEFGQPAAPAKLAYVDPVFQQWVKETQSLPAAQQIEAVSKKLVELNPEFDGKLGNDVSGQGTPHPKITGQPKIEKGVVTEVAFLSGKVSDVSPVRVFAGLKRLVCWGSGAASRLADFSPLTGMELTTLQCPLNAVRDLSPLRGMALRKFISNGCTQIDDLSPLAGLPLEALSCQQSQVRDLSPLEKCKDLRSLSLLGAKVAPDSVAALQKALPNCKIDWDNPAKAGAAQSN